MQILSDGKWCTPIGFAKYSTVGAAIKQAAEDREAAWEQQKATDIAAYPRRNSLGNPFGDGVNAVFDGSKDEDTPMTEENNAVDEDWKDPLVQGWHYTDPKDDTPEDRAKMKRCEDTWVSLIETVKAEQAKAREAERKAKAQALTEHALRVAGEMLNALSDDDPSPRIDPKIKADVLGKTLHSLFRQGADRKTIEAYLKKHDLLRW